LRALAASTRASGPMPAYTLPMAGVSSVILATVASSTRVEGSFFSVASTTPSAAFMPRLVAPPPTAFRAYSIWTSLPLGLNVVRLNDALSVMVDARGACRRRC
jgi:hypothetical protein